MSSLQKQLASIASSTTHELDLKAQKSAHSQSLLFDASIAASQSFDLLYQICAEGFQELCAIDPRFVDFGRTLFNPQSRSEDRNQMTARETEDLNSVIEQYLGLVGSRLLLRPAIKSVEWLVRRFRVHEHNVQSVILTFLPYHSTPVFATLLSILPKQLPPTFKFLHPYINSLQSPPRNVISYTSTHNPAFFDVLNRYVLAVSHAGHHHPPLLSFWAGIAAQTVDGRISSCGSGRQNIQLQREEDFLVQLLPMIDEALAIRNAPELILGTYMVVVILVSKSALDDRTLDALMSAVSQSWNMDIADAGLRCLAVISNQKQDLRLPNLVVRNMLKLDYLCRRLESIAKDQDLQSLLVALANGLLERAVRGGGHQSSTVLQDLLGLQILGNADVDPLKNRIRGLIQNQPRLAPTSVDSLAGLLEVAHTGDSYADGAVGDGIDSAATDDNISTREKDPGDEIMDTSDVPESAECHSFLMSSADAIFLNLLRRFSKATQRSSNMARFLDLPFWRSGKSKKSTLLVTFLARVLVSADSVSIRAAALNCLQENVGHLATSNDDFQCLILFTVLALMDISRRIRQKAADLIKVAYNRRIALQPLAGEGSNQSMYGPSIPSVSLPNKTMLLFLDQGIISELDECVSDAGHFPLLFRSLIQSSSNTFAAHGNIQGRKWRSAEKSEIFSWLAQNSLHSPIVTSKIRLLSIMNRVEKIGGQPRSQMLSKNIQQWLYTNAISPEACGRETLNIMEIDRQYANAMQIEDQSGLDVFLSVTKGDQLPKRSHQLRTMFQQLHHVWPRIKSSRQIEVIKTLLSTTASSREGEFHQVSHEESKVFLREASLEPQVLSAVLLGILDSRPSDELPGPKRRRINSGSTTSSADSKTQDSDLQQHLIKLSLTLEVVDADRRSFVVPLFHALFMVLRHLQDLKSRASTELEYQQSLTLGALSSMAKTISVPRHQNAASYLDLSIVRVDVLVDCIRNTAHTQARHSALLILAYLAKYIPQTVLHGVIPVFTLMSSSTARQNDDMSIYAVDETIQAVIPLLVETLHKQNKDVVQATADIILSFATAFDHISSERRLRLFTLLASSFGTHESLYAIIAALIDGHPSSTPAQKFVTELLRQFGSVDSLITLFNYLNLILCESESSQAIYKVLLGLAREPRDKQTKSSNLMSVIPELVENGIGSAKIRYAFCDDQSSESVREIFGKVLEATFRLFRACSEQSLPRKQSTLILQSMLSLLPLNEFIRSIRPLLQNADIEIRRSILKAAESQLKCAKDVDDAVRKEALELLPSLACIVREGGNDVLNLNAIVCIDTIVERFGKLNAAVAFEAIRVVSSVPHASDSSTLLRSLALHCIASSVDTLRDEFIPLVQTTTKGAIECLRQSLSRGEKDSQLHNAAYAVVISLVDTLPYMIPGKTLRSLLELSSQSTVEKPEGRAGESRMQFLQAVASRMEIGIVFEAVCEKWSHAMERGPLALLGQIDLIRNAIERNGKSAIAKNTKPLLDAILTLLDLRRAITVSYPTSAYQERDWLEPLEKRSIDATIALVLKLNDITFRPFFKRLVKWSTSTKLEKQVSRTRSVTVFNLWTALSERLQWLVAPYYAELLDPTTRMLQHVQSASSAALAASTLVALISSLRHVAAAQHDLDTKAADAPEDPDLFKRDAAEFYNSPTRFEALLPALISRLSSHPAPDTKDMKSKKRKRDKSPGAADDAASADLTAVALTYLASTQRNQPAHLTTLTKALLDLCKDSHARTRINAIRTFRCLTEGVQTLLPSSTSSATQKAKTQDENQSRLFGRYMQLDVEGVADAGFEDAREEWLGRDLPLMLPTVAQVLEDDDEGVEGEAGRWIRGMEGVLGQRLGELLE